MGPDRGLCVQEAATGTSSSSSSAAWLLSNPCSALSPEFPALSPEFPGNTHTGPRPPADVLTAAAMGLEVHAPGTLRFCVTGAATHRNVLNAGQPKGNRR